MKGTCAQARLDLEQRGTGEEAMVWGQHASCAWAPRSMLCPVPLSGFN